MKIRLSSMKWIICMLAASLMLVASSSVASACGTLLYQPKVPKALQK